MQYFKFFSLFFVLMLIPFYVSSYGRNNFHSKIRLVNDGDDRGVYSLRGSWYPLKKVPYRDVFCDYPQLAAYSFAVPYIILDVLHLKYPNTKYYGCVFSVLMMLFLFATVLLLYNLRGRKKYYSLLMLLPASLYFSYNRLDILPVFLTVLAVSLLLNEKYKLSVFALGLGVLTKWYPLILFPVFLSFYHSRHHKINFNMILVYCLTIILGILPTFFWGGMQAFWAPYQFHLSRDFNQESLFYLLRNIFHNPWGFKTFLILQFCIMPLAMIAKIDSYRSFINWTLLSILFFIFFAKFYSPQWILWVLPFLILRAVKKRDLVPIIILDLVTYLYFPIVFDGYPKLLTGIIFIKTLVLLYFIILILKETFFERTPTISCFRKH